MFSTVFNQPFLQGSHTTFVSVFCSPLFCFHVCLFLKQPIICNFILETTLIVHLASILHFFCFVWKYIKGHVLVWTIEIFLAIMSTSETVILINHKFCVFFFSFMYLFLKQWCCCFLQLIKICSASLWHLVFLFIIFPLTCIPASWYILMIRYYPINLSWRDVWLPTALILFCSVNNGWQHNW